MWLQACISSAVLASPNFNFQIIYAAIGSEKRSLAAES